MAFLDQLAEVLRDSPVAKAAGATRYGAGNDPYVLALQNAEKLGYPVPGSTKDVGQAQRYESANLAAKRYGPLPFLTNTFHELFLSPFAEGEGKPNWERWKAGNRGAWEGLTAPPESSGPAPRYRHIR